jgi:hypothetical protein
MQKMEKYIFPPSFDFLNSEEVDPIAMYIFEFSHTLNQQDLADIWQNLPPDIGTTMEESEVAITHPILKKELLGEGGGQSGNTFIEMPNKLKWMVFKVKQRAASNYFKKTVLRNPEVNTDVESGNVTQDEFGATSNIQYNWPYDFFSLVELVKLDAEVEFGNFNESDIANYTDSIPPYEGQNADMEKIEYIVGGMEDDIVPDNQVAENPFLENLVASTQVFAGQNIGIGSTSGTNLMTDTNSAKSWMNILGQRARGEYGSKGSSGYKSSVRFNTINAALSDPQLNEWMARIGMVDGQGNFDKEFPWEVQVSFDYGGLAIPPEMAELR